jgi:hypothetical protein
VCAQLVDYPQLLAAPEAAKLFAPDAIARAKAVIAQAAPPRSAQAPLRSHRCTCVP